MPTIAIDPKYILSANFATMLCDTEGQLYHIFQYYDAYTLAFFISQNDILPSELTRAIFNHSNNLPVFNEQQIRQRMRRLMITLPNNGIYREQTTEEQNVVLEQLCETLYDAFKGCKLEIQTTEYTEHTTTVTDDNNIPENLMSMDVALNTGMLMDEELNTGMLMDEEEYTVADFEREMRSDLIYDFFMRLND